jgi:Activator of Hsp90 ATPase homolog 1-like protein
MKMTTTSKLPSAQAVADTEMGLALASVDVPSPPEFVFRALSEKDEIESWWGSDDTYHMRDYQADFRVGGHYSITGAGVDGSRFPGHGERRSDASTALFKSSGNNLSAIDFRATMLMRWSRACPNPPISGTRSPDISKG